MTGRACFQEMYQQPLSHIPYRTSANEKVKMMDGGGEEDQGGESGITRKEEEEFWTAGSVCAFRGVCFRDWIFHIVKEVTDKLRKVLLQLEEITKCQVCLEALTADIAQCSTGHGICTSCRCKINVCPSCKQRFLSNKPTLLVQVLEVLPRLCQFSDGGCKLVSFSRNHELYCEYRPFKCPISSPNQRCSWDGPVKNFKAHVESKHNIRFASYMVGSSRRFFHVNFKSNWIQHEYLHLVDDQMFLVTGMKQGTRQSFIQLARHLALGQPQHTYYFVITISKKDIVYKHTIKAVPYDECERMDLSPHCMVVPLEEMNSFLNPSGSLEVTFEVIKKKQ